MIKDGKKSTAGLTRRAALTGVAATLGVGLAAGKAASARAEQRLAATLPGAKMCILTPEAMEGPFYFDPKLVRADIAEGHEGAPLALALQVVSATDCAAIKNVRVDLWHADGLGMYSGYRGQGDDGVSTRGQTFLRGTQFSDAGGQARFATIYPGWYPGRTPHIHFKVLLDAKSLVTGQLYFPDDLSTRIYAGNAPYRERKAKRDMLANEEDFIFQDQGGADTLVSVKEEGGSYRASLIIGVAAKGDKRAEGTLMLKIVSGGQTGVDRAALDVAIERGIAYWRLVPERRPRRRHAEPARSAVALSGSTRDAGSRSKPAHRMECPRCRQADGAHRQRRVAGVEGTGFAIETTRKLGKPNIVIDMDGNGTGVLAISFLGEGRTMPSV